MKSSGDKRKRYNKDSERKIDIGIRKGIITPQNIIFSRGCTPVLQRSFKIKKKGLPCQIRRSSLLKMRA